MFGKGMIKKVLMFLIMGPMGLLFGGNFNIMDLMLIPMIAPMFAGMLGGFGNIFGGGGGTSAVGDAT